MSTPRFSMLDEWLSWQETLHFTGIDLGLDRVRPVADRAGITGQGMHVVTVAGTNGKGSSATLLESIFRAAGYRTGLYTSPHLLRYNERIRLDGLVAEDQAICAAFEHIDRARQGISLTYFEFGTLAAMDIFQRQQVQIAVLEVGMGGRLDAVNLFEPEVALLTTVALDHQRWLGEDREAIGREKAGIFRAGKPAVCADPDPPSSVLETADRTGANLLRSGHDFSCALSDEGWTWQGVRTHYDRLPIPGGRPGQISNAAGVLMVVESLAAVLPVPEHAIRQALLEFSLPGRFQRVASEPDVILDVAHNPQAAGMLVSNLGESRGRTLMVLGMLSDKDQSGFIATLLPSVEAWYLVDTPTDRGESAAALAGMLGALAADATFSCHSDVSSALAHARADARIGDRVVVTGSFLTVAAALDALGAGA